MDLQLVATGIADLLPMDRSGDPRSHVSAIIRSLCLRLGHFAGDENNPEAGRNQTRLELGSAFEDAVGHALARRYVKSDPERFVLPGELSKDGLLGTPDLLDVTDWAVIEIKLTWISSRHEPDSVKFWKYWVQLMAYCYMCETLIGRLHVCHLNGDYRASRDPEYNVWEARFTKRELVENWRMLITHQQAMMATI